MKKTISTLFLIAATVATFAQWTNIPTKYQPVKFGGTVVIGDTFAIDTASPLYQYGRVLKMDTLEDGRPYFSSSSFVTETDTGLITSLINDSLDAIRPSLMTQSSVNSLISDTASSIRGYIPWEVGGGGATITPKEETFNVAIGSGTSNVDLMLYVNGVYASSVQNVDIASDANINIVSNMIRIVGSGTDTVATISRGVAGSLITFFNPDQNTVWFSKYATGGNPDIRTSSTAPPLNATANPAAGIIGLPQYGVVTFLVVSATEFWQYGEVTINQ